ncbi:MAG: hypothetical protein ABIV63_15525 [Caldimonas sp.]
MDAIDPFLSELKRAQRDGQQVLAAAAQRRLRPEAGHRRRTEDDVHASLQSAFGSRPSASATSSPPTAE